MSDSEYINLSELVELAKLDGLFSRSYVDAERKQRIADKIMGGERLLAEEKEIVCKALTGALPGARKSRGYPSSIDRDTKLAIEYLLKCGQGVKKNKLKRELAKKHGLRNPDNINSTEKAIRRGKNEAEKRIKSALLCSDLPLDFQEKYGKVLSLIEADNTQKTGK